MTKHKIGILLTNIGTPDKPTAGGVRRYLNKFLNDKRVVELPRWIWWPILYGIILPLRSRKSAKLYQAIWTEQGSPLLIYSKNIAKKLSVSLNLPVTIGMHYSSPSIEDALIELKQQHVSHLLILPLYPQYSATTTAASIDVVMDTFKRWRVIPELRTINQYADNPYYIKTLCDSIRTAYDPNKPNSHLLFSYHGIPEAFVTAGDPYQKHCEQTTQHIVKELQLPASSWSMSYQSRLGRAKWLTPYTSDVIKSLPSKGVSDLYVVCPGFATDCLETLEEINIGIKEQFLSAGGKSFHYIPALNDSDSHITMLEKLVSSHLQGWI